MGSHSVPAAGPNPQVLYAALVGRPSDSDSYKDVRSDYISNEVAVVSPRLSPCT